MKMIMEASNEIFEWNKSILEIGEWEDYQTELVEYIEIEVQALKKQIDNLGEYISHDSECDKTKMGEWDLEDKRWETESLNVKCTCGLDKLLKK